MNNFIKKINFDGASITQKEYEFLLKFIKNNNIKNVLEFGPGVSTYCFIEAQCNIMSIECDLQWYEKYNEEFKTYNNITILYNDFKKIGFINIKEIQNNKYDMIFVDSPPGQAPFSRLNTLLYSFEKSNIILLHDCKRHTEQNSISLLQKIYQFNIETYNENRGIAIIKQKS